MRAALILCAAHAAAGAAVAAGTGGFCLNTEVPAAPRRGAGVAVVTGGTRGIGLGIASALAKDGMDLVLLYGSQRDRAEATAAQLHLRHGAAVALVSGDLTDAAVHRDTVVAVRAALGACLSGAQLRAVVHNAGLLLRGTGLYGGKLLTLDDRGHGLLDLYHNIYTRFYARLVDELAPLLADGTGRVIAVSSPGCGPGAQSPPSLGYDLPGQAKAGMEYLTRIYAKRLAARRITANIIVPGIIRTEAWEAYETVMGADTLDRWGVDKTPMGRWGTPDDVGDVASFLVSAKAGFVTGASLPVDGGLSLSPTEAE